VSAWSTFWHRPEPAENLGAARVLLAGTALWIALSRFDLPVILEWPEQMWAFVPFDRRARFLLLFDAGVERVLYAVLHLALLAALLGVRARAACFLSGLLLYHFAPLESILWTPNPYLRGLTIPALGLLAFSFAPGAASPGGPACGWPLRLVQVLFCQVYFFAGYAKLHQSGLEWVGADNIRAWLLAIDQTHGFPPESSLALHVAAEPALCALIAAAGLGLDLAFPLVLWSAAARRVLLPMALAFHVGSSVLFHIFFQNATLLLLFVDWSGFARAVQSRRG
jgi:hypothetical protein